MSALTCENHCGRTHDVEFVSRYHSVRMFLCVSCYEGFVRDFVVENVKDRRNR